MGTFHSKKKYIYIYIHIYIYIYISNLADFTQLSSSEETAG